MRETIIMKAGFLKQRNNARKRGSYRQALHKKQIKMPEINFLKKKNGNGKELS